MLKKILTTVTILVAMLLIASPIMAGGPGGAKGARILPPTVAKRYTSLTEEWWQWSLSFPASTNPFLVDAGTLPPDIGTCTEEGQPDHVFFLAGGFTGEEGTALTRNCTVPSGSFLFFPIINTECSNLEPEPFFCEDEESCKACNAAFYGDGDVLELSIDGVDIGNLEDFRFQSDGVFEIGPLPDGNILGAPEGAEGISSADGFWIMVTPLSVGEHQVDFHGCFEAFGGCEEFELLLEYNLTVVPRGQVD